MIATVAELIDALSTLPPDAGIRIQERAGRTPRRITTIENDVRRPGGVVISGWE